MSNRFSEFFGGRYSIRAEGAQMNRAFVAIGVDGSYFIFARMPWVDEFDQR